MTILGNIIYFMLGGWLNFLAYTLASIIFFPFFIPLFRLARYAAWPFGRDAITQTELLNYKRAVNANPVIDEKSISRGVSEVLNVVWMFTAGWILALCHLLSALTNLAFFFLIITIPNIGANWKLISVAFRPFNKVIVPKTLAEKIRLTASETKLGIDS